MKPLPPRHKASELVPITEWAKSDDCPWTYERLRQIARQALENKGPYKRLPFFQLTKKSRIFTNPDLMRRRLYELGANHAYRRDFL
jgi:hypothetical protein